VKVADQELFNMNNRIGAILSAVLLALALLGSTLSSINGSWL